MTAILLTAAIICQTGIPEFQPPPGGIGSETLTLTGRGAGMGGIECCIRNDYGLSLLNPAASAWTSNTGISIGLAYAESDNSALDGRASFPNVSFLFPIPGRVVLMGGVYGRSIVSADQTMDIGGFQGSYEWSGGSGELYAGASVLATDWLAFSLGGRSYSGSFTSDVSLDRDTVGTTVPLDWQYLDDAYLRPSWGLVAGVMASTPRLGIGLSIATDRSGEFEVSRDYLGIGADTSSTELYTIPGEVSAGVSFSPFDRVTAGVSYYTRKTLNLLGTKTEEGSIVGFGGELDLGRGLSTRAGYSVYDGLWRDGAREISAGGSYQFSGGRARIDLSVGHQMWSDSLGETSLLVTLWGSESWLR